MEERGREQVGLHKTRLAQGGHYQIAVALVGAAETAEERHLGGREVVGNVVQGGGGKRPCHHPLPHLLQAIQRPHS